MNPEKLKQRFTPILKNNALFGSLLTNADVNKLLDDIIDELVKAVLHRDPPPEFGIDWGIAADLSNEKLAEMGAREQKERDVAANYEAAMGYNPLPWWNDKALARLLRFLLDKTPEEIKTFAAWSKRDYSTFDPSKARQYPDRVIEFWPLAFARRETAPSVYDQLLEKINNGNSA